MGAAPVAVTELLNAWCDGDARAGEELLPVVYRELRRQAVLHLRRERRNHTLSATGLVHEAYLRLVAQHGGYDNRSQFYALAAQMMRRVLVDHARARAASKRPRPELQVPIEDAALSVEPRVFELLTLDRALNELAVLDSRQARLVELRYFGGLTSEETAQVLGVSPATIKREWTLAKAWLHRHLAKECCEPEGGGRHV
jgi:RNA polymerase sigma factor (TIGR02999 family)